ncbi:hypothetical protein QYE76_033449 [Lolium multiflorum]|uniref:Small ribosomal subunit protein uS15 N-terminal domain-containing protein n=1 Tax=Lolium multiflorum TaxID=4521 RepID=A0AAD8QX26_LOLMU|nr:hypothetical protein QYE76_033449 [Lolium multiflorum]
MSFMCSQDKEFRRITPVIGSYPSYLLDSFDTTQEKILDRVEGISSSALPYKRTAPILSQDSPSPRLRRRAEASQIGVLLRDQHGIPLVKSVTGSKILRILKAHGQIHSLDLYFLIKKAVAIRKHLEEEQEGQGL